MYVFYNSTGKIIGGCAADSPDVVLTRIPDGSTALYLNDNEHADVWSNLGRYQIENELPVPRVFTAEDVEQAKQAKITALDAACNATILGGFVSSAVGAEHVYAFDLEAQTNLMSELAMLNAGNAVDLVEWKTVDAGLVKHTRKQFVQVCMDGQAWKKGNIDKYRQLKAQVLAATSIEGVEQFNWERAGEHEGANNPSASLPNAGLRNGISSFFSKIVR